MAGPPPPSLGYAQAGKVLQERETSEKVASGSNNNNRRAMREDYDSDGPHNSLPTDSDTETLYTPPSPKAGAQKTTGLSANVLKASNSIPKSHITGLSVEPPSALVIPPAEIRKQIDKTALFLYRNPSLEERLKTRSVGIGKYNFLSESGTYHGYFQWYLQQLREGKGTGDSTQTAAQRPYVASTAAELARVRQDIDERRRDYIHSKNRVPSCSRHGVASVFIPPEMGVSYRPAEIVVKVPTDIAAYWRTHDIGVKTDLWPDIVLSRSGFGEPEVTVKVPAHCISEICEMGYKVEYNFSGGEMAKSDEDNLYMTEEEKEKARMADFADYIIWCEAARGGKLPTGNVKEAQKVSPPSSSYDGYDDSDVTEVQGKIAELTYESDASDDYSSDGAHKYTRWDIPRPAEETVSTRVDGLARKLPVYGNKPIVSSPKDVSGENHGHGKRVSKFPVRTVKLTGKSKIAKQMKFVTPEIVNIDTAIQAARKKAERISEELELKDLNERLKKVKLAMWEKESGACADAATKVQGSWPNPSYKCGSRVYDRHDPCDIYFGNWHCDNLHATDCEHETVIVRPEGGWEAPQWSGTGKSSDKGCEPGQGSDKENEDWVGDAWGAFAGDGKGEDANDEAFPNIRTQWDDEDSSSAAETKPEVNHLNVSYWAHVASGNKKIHVPIKESDVSDREKSLLATKMNDIWKWVQENKLGDRVTLRDAYDLAARMHPFDAPKEEHAAAREHGGVREECVEGVGLDWDEVVGRALDDWGHIKVETI